MPSRQSHQQKSIYWLQSVVYIFNDIVTTKMPQNLPLFSCYQASIFQPNQQQHGNHQFKLMENMDDVSLTIRVKRDKTTCFIASSPLQSIETLKRKILIFHKGLEVGDIRIYHSNKLLDEKSNIHDQGLLNNSLLYYKLKKGNTGEWEQIPELAI